MEMSMFTEGMMPGPDGSILRFFYDSERNEQATVAEGRAIFDTVLFVDVITPGQKSSTPRFEVERVWSEQSKKALNLTADAKRGYKYNDFAEQIEKFKKQDTVGELGGTPLKMWPRIDRGLAATLMAANVFTVEALAGLSDTNLDIIGIGARDLRAQARAYFEQAAGTADISLLTDRLSNLETEVKRTNEALALANKQNAELQAKLSAAGLNASEPAKTLKDITI
jgi:hypothetical protein